jgi:hypothetical protein
MNDAIRYSLSELQKEYDIDIEQDGNVLKLTMKSIDETLSLSDKNSEYTVFTSAWHEHFDEIGQLESFLRALLSGGIVVVVKYRGKQPVAHQAQMIKDGHTQVVSQAASLISPFWRARSFKTFRYECARLSLHKTRTQRDDRGEGAGHSR